MSTGNEHDPTPLGGSQPIREHGRFHNPWPGDQPARFLDFLKWQLGRRVRQEIVAGPPWPRFELAEPALASPRARPGDLLATWVGHSTVLLQLGPSNVLTDPIWSARASPVGFAGPRRMTLPGVGFESLPPIDLVVLSHNHYDHFDEPTIRMLVERFPEARWVAPLGLGVLLARLGVRCLEELGWWDERIVGDVTVGCTPARHFSARGLGDRWRTLWCGWSIAAAGKRVFFAGDTAHHPEFAVIGDRFGPFDLTLMPIGAYEPRWFMRTVHMNPDEAVRAHREVTASSNRRVPMLPIHWGTFRLTDEPPEEPSARVRALWREAGLAPDALWLLRHGETRSTAPITSMAP